MSQFNLQERNFSDISDDNLETTVSCIITDFPRCGEQMLGEMLTGKGVKV